jgi:hypothetical protein
MPGEGAMGRLLVVQMSSRRSIQAAVHVNQLVLMPETRLVFQVEVIAQTVVYYLDSIS